jgi:hypothetical protein
MWIIYNILKMDRGAVTNFMIQKNQRGKKKGKKLNLNPTLILTGSFRRLTHFQNKYSTLRNLIITWEWDHANY